VVNVVFAEAHDAVTIANRIEALHGAVLVDKTREALVAPHFHLVAGAERQLSHQVNGCRLATNVHLFSAQPSKRSNNRGVRKPSSLQATRLFHTETDQKVQR